MSVQREQHIYEADAWLRTLDYLQQENIYLKNRIVEVIKDNISPELLEKVEHYQNSFLNKDTVIAFLRRDIRLLQEEAGSKFFNGKLSERQKLLRQDMEKMEQEFNHLKFDFNNYLQEVLA